GLAAFQIMAPAIAADLIDRGKATGIAPGPEVLEPISLAFMGFGQTVSAMDYARANNTLQTLAITVGQFMERFDVILAPTLAAPPLPLGRINLTPDCDFQQWGQRVSVFSPFAQMANLTGQPSMSVPLGQSRMGLPIGVMFTGRYGDEALLYRLAGQLERAAPWADRRPVLG
ncbi:MAG: amidase family protein, partial [Novosphingobium sp.]